MPDSILSDFIGQPGQDLQDDFAKRRAAKATRILARVQNMLASLIQGHNETMNDFWSQSDGVGPKALLAELGQVKASSLFTEASILRDFIVSRLKAAGATDDYIKKVLVQTPDQYIVTVNENGVSIEDRV